MIILVYVKMLVFICIEGLLWTLYPVLRIVLSLYNSTQLQLVSSLRLVITSFGVGKIEQSSFMLLFKFLRSHMSRSFSSFSSFATNPAGEIHRAHSFAGILSMTSCLMSFCTSFVTFSFQCKGFLRGL